MSKVYRPAPGSLLKGDPLGLKGKMVEIDIPDGSPAPRAPVKRKAKKGKKRKK